MVDVHAQDLLKSFRDKLLKACNELRGKKLVRQDGGNTWWWNEEVKDAAAKKKKAFKDLCKDTVDVKLTSCYTRKLETELRMLWQVQ